jgi:tellurite resistance protein TerC
VLYWGVIGALAMRAAFTFSGAAALERFRVAFYVFGLFLVATGVRLLKKKEFKLEPEKNAVLQLLKDRSPFTDEIRGNAFSLVSAENWPPRPCSQS